MAIFSLYVSHRKVSELTYGVTAASSVVDDCVSVWNGTESVRPTVWSVPTTQIPSGTSQHLCADKWSHSQVSRQTVNQHISLCTSVWRRDSLVVAVEMYSSAVIAITNSYIWPWPLISDLENLFSNVHSRGEYLWKVSLKSLH